MTRLALMLTACMALAAPAHALDYSCSPLTGGCIPLASQPSVFDPPYPPVVYVPPWPRSCPIDGPRAWTCDTQDRVRRNRSDKR
jgi:hypothetical protein